MSARAVRFVSLPRMDPSLSDREQQELWVRAAERELANLQAEEQTVLADLQQQPSWEARERLCAVRASRAEAEAFVEDARAALARYRAQERRQITAAPRALIHEVK